MKNINGKGVFLRKSLVVRNTKILNETYIGEGRNIIMKK